MFLHLALPIAEKIKAQLAPHCIRIEIAGSIRRQKPDVKDIEIVAIPKPYQTGLFADGIAPIVNQWHKVKGELPCKYTQRILPEGIKLDLFFADADNWGYILALRTGSSMYNQKVLLPAASEHSYRMHDGYVWYMGKKVVIQDELNFFQRIGVTYTDPEFRNA